MKLTDIRPNVESSGQMEEKFFSIKDQGMIFDILRKKMYSNPILAICREISCNARDAHREVDKFDIPIQIVLPNALDWNYRIKDFGPGISPDRIENIFIQYTASTKRDDNIQGGGFGLGCKSPFAYSDSFAIITIHNGIKYDYNCYIDSTNIGKLALLSQEKTREPNGTEIIIPVEPKDAKLFTEWTEQSCRHWTVKPIIKGGTIVWQTPKPILEGKGWAIAQSKDYYERQAKMVIDGIEYPLVLESLRTYADTKLIDASRGNILMYFGVGELTLSASREQIYLDKKTQDKIRLRLQEIQKNIKDLLLQKIDAFPNLWQANIYYRKELSMVFQDLTLFGKLQWKGIDLHGKWTTITCPAFTFTRGKYSHKGGDPNKLSRCRMTSIHFEENSELFFNDLPIAEPTPRHVKKAFEDNPKLNSIHVLCPTDTTTEAVLNKTIHLDKMAPRRLSEITKATGRTYTAPPSARLLVFKFDRNCAYFRQVSYSTIDEDGNDKVLCLLRKVGYPSETRLPILKKGGAIELSIMESIAKKSPTTSFYGVAEDLPATRVKEEFGDFETLEDYMDDKIIGNKAIDFVEIKMAMQNAHHVDDVFLQHLPTFTKLIKNPKSIFLTRAVTHQKIKDINSGNTELLTIYEVLKGEITKSQTAQFLKDHPNWNIELIEKEYEKTYPLLELVDYYRHTYNAEHVAQYINLIDTWNKDQKKTN